MKSALFAAVVLSLPFRVAAAPAPDRGASSLPPFADAVRRHLCRDLLEVESGRPVDGLGFGF